MPWELFHIKVVCFSDQNSCADLIGHYIVITVMYHHLFIRSTLGIPIYICSTNLQVFDSKPSRKIGTAKCHLLELLKYSSFICFCPNEKMASTILIIKGQMTVKCLNPSRTLIRIPDEKASQFRIVNKNCLFMIPKCGYPSM